MINVSAPNIFPDWLAVMSSTSPTSSSSSSSSPIYPASALPAAFPLPSRELGPGKLEEAIRALENSFLNSNLGQSSDLGLSHMVTETLTLQERMLNSPSVKLGDSPPEIDISPLLRINLVSSSLATLATQLSSLEPLGSTLLKSSPPQSSSGSLVKSIRQFVKHVLFSFT
ncbi:hypothetical protein CROQUDRAFT_666638 [Cronartium quercuum f. sp. fusiforme G11]|uniref:Uncharacterized protein n=1 Tax=Cronartium quercuum f. sp. fusiforme G11 TaxID=708437 RepID=A0A9P6N8L8_9BASI|nr:hypothetical protein CROQUDRAFT_666638 [Cronartium quercuum f. sp. fusiforme G11]